MQRTILALAALAVASQFAWADEWSKHWNVSGKPELRISAGDASVIVEAGSDHAIDARLTTVGWSIGPGAVRVEEHQMGDKVEIDVTVPSSHFSWGNHSIRLEVRVPRELVGNLHTGDGSITLRGLHGNLHADTGDGSIHGDSLDGALDVHTGDGSVHIAGRFDNLQLHTQDGSVDVEVQEGSRVQTDWRIQTGDGSVRLRVPHSLSADLEAHTGDGSIHFDVPGATNNGRREHELEAKLNGGGPALVLRTGDGSITVNGR